MSGLLVLAAIAGLLGLAALCFAVLMPTSMLLAAYLYFSIFAFAVTLNWLGILPAFGVLAVEIAGVVWAYLRFPNVRRFFHLAKPPEGSP